MASVGIVAVCIRCEWLLSDIYLSGHRLMPFEGAQVYIKYI